MRSLESRIVFTVLCAATLALTSCSTYHSRDTAYTANQKAEVSLPANYASRLPQQINTKGERVVLVDPNVHAWGAYDSSGNLVRAGLATAGGSYCSDINRGCKTSAGSFRIQSLGAASCKSTRYPKPNGGAPMPYCMFFNKHQGLHGSQYVMEGNASHGCVRMKVSDAEWMRFNFATVGTKVIVKPY
jgi:lipoprotein-anchoring transpeptidase ErfK/SrfK